MEINVLGSGSKGNSIIIKSDNTNLMIDCGLSRRYILNSLNELNMNIDDIDLLLITHEHIDHIRSIKTFKNHLVFSPKLFNGNENIIKEYEIFYYNDLSILPLRLSHDVDICFGYIISDSNESIVYITDTGYVSKRNIELIKNKDRYIFEANHDLDMLYESNRPQILKDRIASNSGHLNNEDSSHILSKVIGDKTKEIILAHISLECNKDELVLESLINTLDKNNIDYSNIKISLARQYTYSFN